jgi:hypothetical protein
MSRTRNYYTFQNGITGSSNGAEWIVEQQISDVVILDSDTIAIDISGTSASGTVYFEAKTTPDSDYRSIGGIKSSDYSIATSTTGINENWLFDANSIYSFRCRVSGVISPINITSKVSKNN